MKLARKDYEFNNPKICHIMPKHIDLDRVMIGLFMLLKYDGRRPVSRTGRIEVTIENLADQVAISLGKESAGLFSQRIDVLGTARRFAAECEGSCDKPFAAQDINVVTHGDGGQPQFPAQFVHRYLAAFFQDVQNALAGSLHSFASFPNL